MFGSDSRSLCNGNSLKKARTQPSGCDFVSNHMFCVNRTTADINYVALFELARSRDLGLHFRGASTPVDRTPSIDNDLGDAHREPIQRRKCGDQIEL